MKKLKIGLIINGNTVDKYAYEIIRWIKTNEDKFILETYISIENKNSFFNKLFSRKTLKKIFFKFLINFEKILLFFYPIHKNHFKKFNIESIIKKKILADSYTKKNISTFSNQTIHKIKNENFDILLRFCADILEGEILNVSKFGVLSFHHGAVEEFRGSPAGFWEVFLKKDQTGFVIQKLNDNLDCGKILFKGYFQTKFFFLLNQSEVYLKSLFYLKKILLDIFNNKEIKEINFSKIGKVYETPKIKNQLKYLYFLFLNIIKKIFFRKVIWSIGFTNYKGQFKHIIKNEKGKFLADPFLFKKNNLTYCFAEEFCFKKNKGYIVSFDKIENKLINKKIVLEENFHLSFPYVFMFNNEIYMCPETSSINEIRIYKCNNFPNKWSYEMTLIKNVKAADSMLFEKDNYWWLISNISTCESIDFAHNLSIFFSKKGPLTNEWQEHKNNPLCNNSKKSRNAGIIFENNEIIRVSQAQGFDKYGKDINFNVIKDISEDNYIEKEIDYKVYKNIKSLFNYKNIHHFCKIDNDIIFDFNDS